jgi:hypothetical protein
MAGQHPLTLVDLVSGNNVAEFANLAEVRAFLRPVVSADGVEALADYGLSAVLPTGERRAYLDDRLALLVSSETTDISDIAPTSQSA